MQPYSAYSDEELLLALRSGEEGAFSAIYEKWFETVYTHAFKRLGDPDQAKDITQDVFLKLWNNRRELDIRNLKAYLFVAARNSVFNLFEKEKRYTPIDTLLLHLQASPQTAEASVLKHELLKAYHEMVNSLPASKRAIFRMYYEEDMDTDEIAQAMDISRKTVQNQLRSAVLQLRAGLTTLLWLMMIADKL